MKESKQPIAYADFDDELETMKEINKMLQLYDSNARARILNWIISKNELKAFPQQQKQNVKQ